MRTVPTNDVGTHDGNLNDLTYHAVCDGVQLRFSRQAATGPLFQADLWGEDLWGIYLRSFPLHRRQLHKENNLEGFDHPDNVAGYQVNQGESVTLRVVFGDDASPQDYIVEMDYMEGL